MAALKNIVDKMKQLEQIIQQYGLHKDQSSVLDAKIQSINNLILQMKRNEFNITVLGTMKSGKSSFINAILGFDLMPNENDACTLVPVEVTHEKFDKKVEKHFIDGTIEYIRGKKIEQIFLQDIRDYRKALAQGEPIQLKKYTVNYPLFLEVKKQDIRIKIIDTPGPNEMKMVGRNDLDVEEVFLDSLYNSSQILFVMDIQYFQDEENKRLLDIIMKYRPELTKRITFIINKVDRFMTTKELTIEHTETEVKRTLKAWGMKEPQLFFISSKKALLGRIAKQFTEGKTIVQSMFDSVLKVKSPLESYKDEFDEVLPLLSKEIKGKQFHFKPNPEEYFQELISESNILEFEAYLVKQVIDNLNSLLNAIVQEKYQLEKVWLENLINEYQKELYKQQEKVRNEKIYKTKHSLENIMKKINSVNTNNKTIEMLQRNINFDDIQSQVERENKFSKRFSSSYLPSYSTEWDEYRRERRVNKEDTRPGRDKNRLEEYFFSVIEELSRSLDRTKRNILSEKVNILKSHLKEGMETLEREINDAAVKNNLSLRANFTKNCSLLINDRFNPGKIYCPDIYIDWNYRSEERLIFKGLGTIDYDRFRLSNMSRFKDHCRFEVQLMIDKAISEIKNEINKIINDQIGIFIDRELNQFADLVKSKLNDVNVQAKDYDEQIIGIQKILDDIDSIKTSENDLVAIHELVELMQTKAT